ncbi:molybdopterin cofactor-binding domain-containing protein [Bradyrhizobium sp. CCBAU 53340]|uniref:xanthine dehydrogenase family protein molybdopterin-binding subunit n=1 Tax=Bradyrhizobium sp. CCBAU 53340 TaxID=1325112 RepID=UPI00188B2DF1|nr:molybdopterin cofactor-binding domain-containing protein [Bradyrhizobium sp. CCBAU 53340]
MTSNDLPPILVDNPWLDQWITIKPGGRVRFATGKVELGQGVLTALAQLVSEEMDVSPDRLDVVSGDTDGCPDEHYTAGSISIEKSGAAVRLVAAEVREIFCSRAAQQLNCQNDAISIMDGAFLRDGQETGESYWSLSGVVNLHRPATGSAMVKSPASFKVIGTSLKRIDLPAKVFGAGFIHDIWFKGILHARVLHQPWPGARIDRLERTKLAKRYVDAVEIVRTGDFAALVGEREEDVVSAWHARERFISWTGGAPLQRGDEDPSALRKRTIKARTLCDEESAEPAMAARTVTATYSRPWLAHASIGPSCAIALFEAGHLTVWTHAQGVNPLRNAIATALALDPSAINVIHRQGAGCYGHNGADDAAFEAALIACSKPGAPIRVMWMREDEMTSSPLGPAAEVTIDVGLGDDGKPLTWGMDILSPVHGTRPGMGGRVNLLSAQLIPNPPSPSAPVDISDASGGGGIRNGFPIYDFPRRHVLHRLVTDPPVRSSSMRGLGALANVFAIESMMDELAELVGRDPVDYRLENLSDLRGRKVIEAAAAMAGWRGPGEIGSGRGRGFAFSRYKNRAAYLAMVVDLLVDEEIRLERFWIAADAGLVINPDGAINQIEGGAIQAASWTIKERVRFEDGVINSNAWEHYPVLRFSEIPEIEVKLIGSPKDLSLGIGEVALGPTAAAIGNAVAVALGARVRSLPLSREQLMSALFEA